MARMTSPPTVAGANTKAPDGPGGLVVDVGDLAVATTEAVEVGAWRYPGPANGNIAVVRQDARGWVAPAQLGDEFAARPALQLSVQPGWDPIGEAPAHVRVGPFRSYHLADIVEGDRRAHFERHDHMIARLLRR